MSYIFMQWCDYYMTNTQLSFLLRVTVHVMRDIHNHLNKHATSDHTIPQASSSILDRYATRKSFGHLQGLDSNALIGQR